MCRDKGISYLPPMTPLSSAATMRSLHSEASTHDRYGPFVSAPCLTLTGTSGATLCSRCGSHASTFLPPFPRRDFAFRAFSGSPPQRYYGDSDSCTAHLPCRSPRLPRHTFLSFRLQPRELPGHRLTPRQRDQRVSDFALESQARRSPRRIEFVLLRTNSSPPVALHPASRRRSYLRLRSCGILRHGLSPC